MNLYCDLETFKDRLGVSGSSDDAQLLLILEQASRAIDNCCNRWFYVSEQTRYFDGCRRLLLLDTDLLAITSLKTDDDGDSAYETTWSASDYELLPYSASPKRAIAVTPWGTKASFAWGNPKAIQVTGRWGYQESFDDTGADINEGGAFAANDTTLTVTDGTKFKRGMTLRIDSEQLYVSAISGNNLTVTRGVNGTSAASHANDADISVYRYPSQIVEACVMLASRAWKRRDSAFLVNTPPAPQASPLAELDGDVRALLAPLRRLALAAV